MKNLLLFISFLLAVVYSYSQVSDICFIHTTTASNISTVSSFIDHPSLNNNPSARILVSHSWDGDGTGNYNTKNTGIWYSTVEEKWAVYNEDLTNMAESMSFNIYVPGTGANLIEHTLVGGNYFEHVDNAELNNNPTAKPILTHSYPPNSINCDYNMAFDYDSSTSKWWIYNQDLSNNIPTDATFNILVEPAFYSFDNNIAFTHQSTAGNTSGNLTIIDNPLLNNNPDACFVMTYNYDPAGTTGGVASDNKAVGTWYNGSNWTIYNEDLSAFIENQTYNVVLPMPHPDNDEPTGNIAVSVGAHGSTCTSPTYMTNVGATDSNGVNGLPAPSCGNYLGGDIFYYFVAPPSGQVIISRTNDDWDFLSYSLHAPLWANEIACGSINNGVTDSGIITGLTPGMNIGLRFWEWNNNSFGSEGFCVREHDPTAGIADAIIDGFSMYPNPVENVLNLDAENTIESVRIYNMLGQEVLQTTTANTQVEIDTSTLSTGSYLVKVQAGNQIGSYNLIKQ